MALRDYVLPHHLYAVVNVDETVIVGQAEGDCTGIEAAGEAEPISGDGGGAGKVELDGVVQLVGVDAVDFGDVVVTVRRDPVEDTLKDFDRSKPELRREDGVEDALAEGPNAH